MEKENNMGGFTLIEVIIAISIFTIGILAVGSMQISAINGNESANNLTGATTWGQDKVEELLALPYANVATGGPINQGIYTITWTATNCPAANCPVSNAKFITITVTWQQRGVNKTVTFTNIKPAL
jgi:prepilin-type N-terminal cleavage/methylation domain-containing protein